MLLKRFMKLTPVLALAGFVVFTAPAMADDGLKPLCDVGNGMEAVGKGVITTVATPLVAVDNLADGRVDEAIVNTVTLPVRGVISTTAGTVQIVSGLGNGIFQAGGSLFGAVADAAGEIGSGVNERPFPLLQNMLP